MINEEGATDIRNTEYGRLTFMPDEKTTHIFSLSIYFGFLNWFYKTENSHELFSLFYVLPNTKEEGETSQQASSSARKQILNKTLKSSKKSQMQIYCLSFYLLCLFPPLISLSMGPPPPPPPTQPGARGAGGEREEGECRPTREALRSG